MSNVAEGMNLEAERTAPCPFCGGSASPQRYGNSNGGASYAVWCNSCHISTAWMHGDDGECRAIEAWNRRTAAPVEEGVALPPLPPIDEHWMTNDHTYTAEQVRQAQRDAIAPYAERIRQLKRELEARAKSDAAIPASSVQSIDGDKEFINRMNRYFDLCTATNFDVSIADIAWKNLVAYIDGRTAGTAPATLYTCKGKGGEYELIGKAMPAGVLGSTLMVSNYSVYRDIKSGKMFVRTASDFEQRMERIAAAPSPLPPQEEANGN